MTGSLRHPSLPGHMRHVAAGLLLTAAVTAAVAGCATGGVGSSTPAASAGGGGSPAAALPLHGTWTTSITKDDLAAKGVSDPGLQNENSGRFQWTFAPDGTWTSVQQSLDGSPINGPVFQGTYVVAGDQLVSTTTFPEQYRDAGLHYTWAIDGANLVLDILDPPDPMLPVVVEAHPWTRVP